MFKTLLALLFLTSNCYSRQLSVLITDTRTLGRDASSSTRQRFADSDITNYLNQGQREAIARTKCIDSAITFQLTIGATYYSLPSNYLAPKRVTRGGFQLTELTPAGLDGRSRGWESASGLPVYYFINFSSRGLIGFTPYPQASTDTDTVKVEYYADAIDMASNTDQPFNNISELFDFHQMLPYYAAARMAIIDGRTGIVQAYMQIYENILKSMGDSCKMRPNYMPSAVATP